MNISRQVSRLRSVIDDNIYTRFCNKNVKRNMGLQKRIISASMHRIIGFSMPDFDIHNVVNGGTFPFDPFIVSEKGRLGFIKGII